MKENARSVVGFLPITHHNKSAVLSIALCFKAARAKQPKDLLAQSFFRTKTFFEYLYRGLVGSYIKGIDSNV